MESVQCSKVEIPESVSLAALREFGLPRLGEVVPENIPFPSI